MWWHYFFTIRAIVILSRHGAFVSCYNHMALFLFSSVWFVRNWPRFTSYRFDWLSRVYIPGKSFNLPLSQISSTCVYGKVVFVKFLNWAVFHPFFYLFDFYSDKYILISYYNIFYSIFIFVNGKKTGKFQFLTGLF